MSAPAVVAPRTRRELHGRQETLRPRRTVGLGIGAGLLALTVLLAIVAVLVPAVTGAQTYTVLTRSMEPGYPPGTYLVVRPTPIEDIAVGDVITYQLESGESAVVTHRVTSIELASDGERRLVTKGDNNAVADPEPVRPVQIRGVLWYAVPYLGWATGLRGEDAAGVWIPVAAGLVFCYAAVMAGGWAVDRRRAVRNGGTARPSSTGEGLPA